MRLIFSLIVLIPIVAASTKYYSMKAQVYCATRPYTGEAKMWIIRGINELLYYPFTVDDEEPSVLKTLPIIDGFLNVTVKDDGYDSIKSYYLTIDAHDHTCCPKGVATYKSLPYMARTFNYHDNKELAQFHPYDLKGIELINYCPDSQYEYIPQK
uniref:NTR domain-containing protein n=1 Tax=Panagrellus redivivus TaxID=6233 RepID=A0A7E4V6X9_PANRE